jgi:Outer membrane protein
MNTEELNENIPSQEENTSNEISDQVAQQDNCTTQKHSCNCRGLVTLILACLSFIGVVVLLIMILCCKNTESKDTSKAKIVQSGNLKIAYVNTDTIMAKYQYAKDLEKALAAYQSQLSVQYQSVGTKLKTEYENYMKTGEKLTLTQQKQKEQQLQAQYNNLPQMQQQMMKKLQDRQASDNKKLINAVYAFIKDYNQKHAKYNIILARSYVSSPVLYADEGFNITDEIVKGLNEEYKKVKEK